MWTRRQWLGALAGGAGAALGCAHAGLGSLGRARGSVALWLLDAGLGRGPEGGALVGLDRDAFVVRLVRLPMPRAVAFRAGRLWVSVALHGSRRGPFRLLELGPEGELLGQRPMASGARFALDREGLPWVLSAEPGPQELRDPDGHLVLRGEQLLGPVFQGAGVALASRHGELFLADKNGAQQRHVDARIQTLVAAKDGPRWLGRSPGGDVLLGGWGPLSGELPSWLGRALEGPREPSLALGPGTALWISGGMRGKLWLVSSTGRLLRQGEVEEPTRKLVSDGRGGAWVVLAGALAHVDAQGNVGPGQGGFGNCQDLALVDPIADRG